MQKQRVLTALLLGLAACGGGSSGAPPGAAPTPMAQTQRRDPNLITRAEIDQATWATNAFDLVQRLRPNFLRISGPTSWTSTSQEPMVRLNDQEFSSVGALRQIQTSAIKEIRYYSASDATAKFGGRRGRPVIAVSTH